MGGVFSTCNIKKDCTTHIGKNNVQKMGGYAVLRYGHFNDLYKIQILMKMVYQPIVEIVFTEKIAIRNIINIHRSFVHVNHVFLKKN